MEFFPPVRSLFRTVRLLNFRFSCQVNQSVASQQNYIFLLCSIFNRDHGDLTLASYVGEQSEVIQNLDKIKSQRVRLILIHVFFYKSLIFTNSRGLHQKNLNLVVYHKIFPPVRLFQTVRLLFFPNFPARTFIPDRTFISVISRGGGSTGAAGAFAPVNFQQRLHCTRPDEELPFKWLCISLKMSFLSPKRSFLIQTCGKILNFWGMGSPLYP